MLPRLAFRNVARQYRRTAATFLMLFFGVGALVVLRGVENGFTRMLIENAVQGRTGAIQVHRRGYLDAVDALPLSLDLPASPAFIRTLEQVPGVSGVTGRILFSGLVTNGRVQTPFFGRGIDPATDARACPRTEANLLPGGAKLMPEDHAVAHLGIELSRALRAPSELGSVTLSVTSPLGRANSSEVTVKGVTASGLIYENKKVITVPLALAQELLGMEGRVTEYALAVSSLDQVDETAARLRLALGDEYEVHTWKDIQPFLRDSIWQQQVLLDVVSLLLCLVVLIGIMSEMLKGVFERVREIGTLLALGMRRRGIVQLFLIEAAFIGAAGGVAGALAGRGVVELLFLRGIPLTLLGTETGVTLRPFVDPSYVAACAALAILDAVLAAAYPARQAAKLSPVEALRSL